MGNKGTNNQQTIKSMNQYRNINPNDESERFVKFQIHRKTARAKKGKEYNQAIVMIPAAIKKELGWEKGDILVMKFDKKTKTLMVRKTDIYSESQAKKVIKKL